MMVKRFFISLENSDEWENSADWGLYVAKWNFPLPKIKKSYISVNGMNGDIDLSSELIGDVAYEDVEAQIEFFVLRNSSFDFFEFKNKFHGRRVKLMADTDTEHYRVGRMTIDDNDGQDVLPKIKIKVKASPLIYSLDEKRYQFNTTQAEEINFDGMDSEKLTNFEAVYEGNTISINNTEHDGNIANLNGGYLFDKWIINEPLNVIAIEPNTDYFIEVSFTFLAGVGSGFTAPKNAYYWNQATCFFGIELPDESLKQYIDATWEAGETVTLRKFFNSGDNTTLAIQASGRLARKGSVVFSHDDSVVVTINTLAKVNNSISIKNEGRIRAIPQITSTVDCLALINETASVISSEKPKSNFDLILDGTDNKAVFISDIDGVVTLTYREAWI